MLRKPNTIKLLSAQFDDGATGTIIDIEVIDESNKTYRPGVTRAEVECDRKPYKRKIPLEAMTHRLMVVHEKKEAEEKIEKEVHAKRKSFDEMNPSITSVKMVKRTYWLDLTPRNSYVHIEKKSIEDEELITPRNIYVHMEDKSSEDEDNVSQQTEFDFKKIEKN